MSDEDVSQPPSGSDTEAERKAKEAAAEAERKAKEDAAKLKISVDVSAASKPEEKPEGEALSLTSKNKPDYKPDDITIKGSAAQDITLKGTGQPNLTLTGKGKAEPKEHKKPQVESTRKRTDKKYVVEAKKEMSEDWIRYAFRKLFDVLGNLRKPLMALLYNVIGGLINSPKTITSAAIAGVGGLIKGIGNLTNSDKLITLGRTLEDKADEFKKPFAISQKFYSKADKLFEDAYENLKLGEVREKEESKEKTHSDAPQTNTPPNNPPPFPPQPHRPGSGPLPEPGPLPGTGLPGQNAVNPANPLAQKAEDVGKASAERKESGASVPVGQNAIQNPQSMTPVKNAQDESALGVSQLAPPAKPQATTANENKEIKETKETELDKPKPSGIKNS